MRQSILDEWIEESKRKENVQKKIQWEEWEEALVMINDYQEIKIAKRNGSYRKISIPSEKLKKVQREILCFLKKLFPKWYCEIQGLYRGSYIEHARFHSNSRFIFQLDIKEAFPSVSIERLRKILYRKICSENIVGTIQEAEHLSDLIIALTTFKGVLPQGAPTSPFLFYIYLLGSGVIEGLYRCCYPGWKFSCYIDGFVISGQKFIPGNVREKIIKTIEGSGLQINEKKIHFRDCWQGNPMITGISVDGKGRICLPKKKIRRWRGIIHRAALETNPFVREYLSQKIEGFIASLRPIYGENLPPQIKKPYLLFKESIRPI